MTNRSSESIGSIEVLGQGLQAQQALKHSGHLLLAGTTASGDRHLDLLGRIFSNGYFPAQACSHRNSLRPSQLQHRLYILSKERSFNGYLVGVIGVDQFDGPLEDQLQLEVWIFILLKVKLIELQELHFFPDHLDQPKSHDGGSGVNAQYDFLSMQKLCNIAGLNCLNERGRRFLKKPMGNLSHKANKFLVAVLKIAVVLAALFFIGYKLTSDEQLDFNAFLAKLEEFRVFSALNLAVLLLLTFLNWLFEIKKWQKLSSALKSNSVRKATNESLASFTAAIFTPSRIGEYGAKSLYYPKADRKKVIFLNFVGNMTQLFVTFVFGIIGLIYLLFQVKLPFTGMNIGLIIALLFSPFYIYWLVRKFNLRIKGYSLKKLEKSFKKISNDIQWKTLYYAGLRYIIFTHQFYFLLLVFNVQLPYLLLISAVFSTYFLASLIPTMIIFDAVIKGGFGVWIFGFLGVPEIVVLVIVLAVWILNFGLPALLGSYYVLKYKPEIRNLVH